MDVVALGELLIDFSCREKNNCGYPVMDGHPGGGPANWLAPVSRFGGSAAFIGKVGDDSFGRMLAKTLSECGISTEGLVFDKNVFTTLAFVTFDENNDREFSFARKPGADTMLGEDEINYALIEKSRVLHFGTLSLTDEPSRSATYAAVEFAKKHGKLISFDPNLRKPLWKNLDDAKREILWGISHADVLKISDEEVDFVFNMSDYEAAAHKLVSDYGVSLVMVTLGKNGCIYATGRASGRIPALSGVTVLDTTGAGDIFGGSAMYALLEKNKAPGDLTKEDLDWIVTFACTSAGLSTEKEGGVTSVPDKKDVLARMGK